MSHIVLIACSIIAKYRSSLASDVRVVKRLRRISSQRAGGTQGSGGDTYISQMLASNIKALEIKFSRAFVQLPSIYATPLIPP